MYVNDTEILIPLYKKFGNELKSQGRTITWLAAQLGFCYAYTHRLIRGKLPMTEKTWQKINQLLGTDYCPNNLFPSNK